MEKSIGYLQVMEKISQIIFHVDQVMKNIEENQNLIFAIKPNKPTRVSMSETLNLNNDIVTNIFLQWCYDFAIPKFDVMEEILFFPSIRTIKNTV